MAKPEKVGAVAEITGHFQNSTAAVLTEYRGLTVLQLTQLRRSLGAGTTYSVVKNTLTTRAAHDAGITELDALLTGPTAIAFVTGDPVPAAKALREFARANSLLVVKGGVLEGKMLSASEIAALADLESREVLLAKLAGAMKGNLTKAVGLFQAPLSQLARLAAALIDKRAAEQPPVAVDDAVTVETPNGVVAPDTGAAAAPTAADEPTVAAAPAE